ncbi:MAG: hypothetical protein ACYCWN_08240 [Ferrimicrobium sp.]
MATSDGVGIVEGVDALCSVERYRALGATGAYVEQVCTHAPRFLVALECHRAE